MSTWPLLVTIGFGLVALSAVFLVYVFWRAWRDDAYRLDRRYRIVAAALAIGKIGIFFWALNPLSIVFYGTTLPLPVLILASVMILAAAITLLGSTALGGDKWTLKAFLVASAAWTAFCIWRAS
jgi:hypothetical protein